MSETVRKKHVLGFSMTLEFPEEVEARGDALMETVIDAINKY